MADICENDRYQCQGVKVGAGIRWCGPTISSSFWAHGKSGRKKKAIQKLKTAKASSKCDTRPKLPDQVENPRFGAFKSFGRWWKKSP